MPVASLTLKDDQISVVPISAIMIRTKASRLASSASAAFSNRARLAFGPSADHAANAAEAAATAASASKAVAAAARLATSCDSGLRRSNTLPLEAARSCPLMRRLTSMKTSLGLIMALALAEQPRFSGFTRKAERNHRRERERNVVSCDRVGGARPRKQAGG